MIYKIKDSLEAGEGAEDPSNSKPETRQERGENVEFWVRWRTATLSLSQMTE